MMCTSVYYTVNGETTCCWKKLKKRKHDYIENERVAISHVFICANDLLDRPLDVQYVKKNI